MDYGDKPAAAKWSLLTPPRWSLFAPPLTDTADYSASTDGVTVDLSVTAGQTVSASQGTDTLTSIEDVVGSAQADTLTGDVGNNTLTGGGGVDVLDGGSDGVQDIFRYESVGDGTAAVDGTLSPTTGDTITNFTSGTDKFHFLSSAFGIASGSLSDGTNFFTLSNYDGTNSGAADDVDHFVFDTTSNTLYYDDDNGGGGDGNGFTVIGTTGGTVLSGDIEIVSS